MRKTQTKKLRKAIRDSLINAKMSPDKYGEIFHSIYKQAKKEFKNTPWNEKNTIKIS